MTVAQTVFASERIRTMITISKKLRCCCTSLYRADAVRYGMIMMLLVVGLLFTAQPAAAQNGTSPVTCIRQTVGGNPSCSANDVRIGKFTAIGNPAPCDPNSNTPITVTLQATIESGPARYDVGIWINQQGGSAQSDTSGNDLNCYRDYLAPPLSSNSCEPDGPYYDADGNNCGDVYAVGTTPCGASNAVTGPCSQGGGTCLFTTYTFTVDILCRDQNNNGTADVGSCTSWKQNPGACTGVLQTDPGTGSKCNCGVTDIIGLRTGCITDADCDDGIACTNDSCSVDSNGHGTCVNATDDSKCTDSNGCTDDSCSPATGDPVSGCVFTPVAGRACGDSSDTDCDNPDTCDASGVCQANHEPTTTACGDAAGACTNADFCDGAGGCTDNGFKSATTACGDQTDTACDNPDHCSGVDGSCVPNHEADGTNCGDAGTECTNQDTCLAGVCNDNGFKGAGTPCGSSADTACDNPDTCNGSGTCLTNNEANGTACDDGTVCDGHEVCGSGTCQPGTPLNCDDGNACTTDTCDPSSGCHSSGSCPVDTQIAPTATTCSDYKSGTADNLEALLYGTKGGVINSVSPGVFFLYDGETVTVANSTITVTETDGPWLPAAPILARTGQVVLYDVNCNKLNVGTVSIAADGTVTITGVPIGTYILGIKYDSTTLKGYTPDGNPSTTYTFTVTVNAANSGSDSINVIPKP
jgi:hypothetical protein